MLDGNLADKLDTDIEIPTYDSFRLQGIDILSASSYDILLKVFLDPSKQWNDGIPDWCRECQNHKQHFEGESVMHFDVAEEVKFLVVHSRYLVYEDLILKKNGLDEPIKFNLSEDKENEYIIIATNGLAAGSYTLESKYIGFLQPNNYGLYISQYEEKGKTHWIASTQMEGPFARRTFPCFDEPEYKATYRTTLMHESKYDWTDLDGIEYYALSNQQIKNGPKRIDGWVTTEFEETEKMSTYITAFAIVDFASTDTTSPISNTPSELLARRQLIGTENGGKRHMESDKIDTNNPIWFPRECTGRTTDRLGESLSLNYDQLGINKKADQIALPDFDAGAMENWGLVTYREQSLLFDMNRDRYSRKSYVCTTIAHEMAHMWFGDYVTCPWWDELWINEAFATYFSFVGLEPSANSKLDWTDDSGVSSWDLDHNLITGRTVAAMNADQTTSSNPIINIENRNPSDPVVKGHGNYGSSSIIYSKGSIVLSMTRCLLGDKAFFGGLNEYLDANKYGNPNSTTLFNAWDDYLENNNYDTSQSYVDKSESLCGVIGANTKQPTLPAGQTVNGVLDTWTRQMGYPFISVNSKTENGKTVLSLQQKRFLTNPEEDISKPDSNLNYLWYVPLSIATSNGYSHVWLDASSGVQAFEVNEADFVVVNNQFRSLARVLYQNNAADNLQAQLASKPQSVDSKTRAQIVFDYFAFAENPSLTGVSITDALEFTDFVRNDDDKTVWELYQDGIKYMRDIMKYTDDKDILDGYLKGIVEKFYQKNNWGVDVGKISDMDRVAMSVALVEACKYGNEDCLEKAKSTLDKFEPLENLKNEPDRDRKLSAYCYGVQENNKNYEKLWDYYQIEQNANEQSVLRSGMACSKDEKTIRSYLKEALGVSTLKVC